MIVLPQRLTLAGLIGASALLTACGGGSGGGGTTPPAGDNPSSSSSVASSAAPSSSSSQTSSASSSSSSQASSAGRCDESAVSTATTRIEAECAAGATVSDDALSGGEALATENGSVSYTLNVGTSGLFTLSYRAQTGQSEARWSASVNGEPLPIEPTELASDASGQWQTLTTEPFYLSDGAQTLSLELEAAPEALDYLALSYNEPTELDAHDAVADMGIGINMGNTLDAPHEGDWAPKAQKAYFVAYKEAGFDHVRIPATWDNHTADEAPYQIDPERMDRTEQIVDWALAQGYEVILNAHHEHWLDQGNGYQNADNRARFDAIWRQIAERFAHKSPRLIFEILNEPEDMSADEVNDLNPRILGIIRQSNPNRLVVVAGSGYTPVSSLADIELPEDDHLIGNFHSYDPWPFAGQCTRSWGSQADKDALAGIYQIASDWASDTGVPVMVNEFGVAHYDYNNPQNVCDQQDRLAYLREHVNLATSHGIAATVWDDGGSFEVYKREEDAWRPAKDVLVNPTP